MPDPLKILVPVLLVAEALAVQWAGHAERVPATPDLSAFPRQIGRWNQSSEIPIEPDVEAQLRADRLLDRVYFSGVPAGGGSQAEVLVAWFNSQTKGDRQPHSPRVCLPGAGWLPESTGTVGIETPAGRLAATQYIVSKGGFRSAVLYWYQTPRRTIAGEWEAKSWILVDALRDHRTDVALVRIVVPSFNGQTKAATDAAAEFARAAYPLLRRELPGIRRSGTCATSGLTVAWMAGGRYSGTERLGPGGAYSGGWFDSSSLPPLEAMTCNAAGPTRPSRRGRWAALVTR